ncbi:hypothetical protein FGK60_09525 [Streptomyces sp. DASNCL29]|nr:hypothetical protein FGK60_09525 [Streptomyces sp. DASNCL29]
MLLPRAVALGAQAVLTGRLTAVQVALVAAGRAVVGDRRQGLTGAALPALGVGVGLATGVVDGLALADVPLVGGHRSAGSKGPVAPTAGGLCETEVNHELVELGVGEFRHRGPPRCRCG